MYYFFRNGYCWINNNGQEWKTNFKERQIKSIQKRNREWHEAIAKDGSDPDYRIICQIILKEL